MLTTKFTICGIAPALLPALHSLFAGDALCSEFIASGTIADGDPTKLQRWMEGHERFPLAALNSSQFNNRQGTYTVEIELLCECVLENAEFADAVSREMTSAERLKFRSSSKPLLLIYRTLGLLEEAEKLEVL